jgi:peptide/nickel transport system substrate-binding protein
MLRFSKGRFLPGNGEQTMRISLRKAALAAVSAAALGAAAAAQAQTITIAVEAPITSVDPHYHNLSPNNGLADILFGALVNYDERVRPQPGLAVSWRAVDETTWEFRLRPNVRFHNGNPFTAEDVAFTLARVPTVPNSPSSFATFTRPITGVEIVDPLTIRFRTATPYPLIVTDLASVRILNRAVHEGATTEDFNSGRVAIGAGPYRLVSFRQGDRVELERFDGYWGPAPAYQRATLRMITNNAARTAALLAGDVDAIAAVPTSDLARLRADQRFVISEADSVRLIYLALDHSRDANSPGIQDNEGRPIADRNPLRDVRVRRALSMAIDRAAISARVMEGTSIPAGQFLGEGTFAYVPDLRPTPFDLEGARRLLAEAGYPNGFRITLAGPNDRYVNDARIIQAIGQMWTRAGIRTSVEALPWTAYVPRSDRQEFSAFLYGWGSASGEPSSPLRALVATFNRERGMGPSNRGRYSNPEVDRLLAEALRTVDDAARERILQQAIRVVFDDVGIIPIHIQKNLWAMRRGIAHVARADELTRPQDFRPAN